MIICDCKARKRVVTSILHIWSVSDCLKSNLTKLCQAVGWRRDLNPQPSEHESPPITTRPGIPPVYSKVLNILYCNKTVRTKVTTGFPQKRLLFIFMVQKHQGMTFSGEREREGKRRLQAFIRNFACIDEFQFVIISYFLHNYLPKFRPQFVLLCGKVHCKKAFQCYKFAAWTEVVVQLIERLLSTPEDLGSNPDHW